MKTIIATGGSKADSPLSFRLEEQPKPRPQPRDLLVRVLAMGMNPVDTKIRSRAQGDVVLGWDVCGVVEKTGTEVSSFKAGDRVFYAGELNRPGGNSEYHLVDERLAAKAPEVLSDAEAAAMPLTSITAWEALFVRLGFAPQEAANTGKSVLIIGGAGGVGSMATQLARWAGVEVFSTASRPDTVEWCEELGALHILNHRKDLATELLDTGTQFVDAIFCTTQMERHWNAMAECIRPQGRIALIDDPENPLDIRVFKQKSVSIHWEFMYTRSLFKTDEMAEQGGILTRVGELVTQGKVRSTLRRTMHGLSAEHIREMHLRQETGTMIGKQVLVVG